MAGEREVKRLREHDKSEPEVFTEEKAGLAVKLYADLNATDKAVAAFFEITPSRLKGWVERFPDFAERVSAAKEAANKRVEKALFEKATGYEHPAVKIMQYEGEPVEVPYVERYAPDTEAAKFWLKNRDPENWKDVTKSEITGADGALLPIINITIKEP